MPQRSCPCTSRQQATARYDGDSVNVATDRCNVVAMMTTPMTQARKEMLFTLKSWYVRAIYCCVSLLGRQVMQQSGYC